jgi:hypothetical protein
MEGVVTVEVREAAGQVAAREEAATVEVTGAVV